MNWRQKFDLYNARLSLLRQQVGWFLKAVKRLGFRENIDWREIFDLYNAHLFAATVATAKAEKFFKIQTKQSISVGMWAKEFNQRA